MITFADSQWVLAIALTRAVSGTWRCTSVIGTGAAVSERFRPELAGRSEDELASSPFAALLPGRSEEVIATGVPAYDEVKLTIEGRPLPVDVVWLPGLTGREDDNAEVLVVVSHREHDEAFFQALLTASADSSVVIDPQARVTYASSGQLLGSEDSIAPGRKLWEVLHPDDVERAMEAFATDHREGGPGHRLDVRVLHADGTWRWVEVIANNLFHHPVVAGGLLNLRDVTARKAMESALRESEGRFRNLADASPVGIFMTDLNGKLEYANPRLTDVLQGGLGVIMGDTWNEFIIPEDRAAFASVEELWSNTSDAAPSVTLRIRRGDEEVRWVELHGASRTGSDGERSGIVGTVQDVTERHFFESELVHRAQHDNLTGLAHRSVLFDRLEHALRRLDRHSNGLAVLFIDLDGFKQVNDAMGHATGDNVLIEMAARLAKVVRPSDTVARYGGDEFVILCEDGADQRVAKEVAERIIAAVNRPVTVGERETVISASVGIALADQPRALLTDVMARADRAMYMAKVRGGNTWVVEQ